MSTLDIREDEPVAAGTAGLLDSLRRHWVPVAAIAVALTLIGALAGFLQPATHTAEARVAVGKGDLTSGAIAGFPLAARELASNYSRYINDTGVAGDAVPDGATLSASPIPESNVIRIRAESRDEAQATAVAAQAAADLVAAVNTNDAERGSGATLDGLRAAHDTLREATSVFEHYTSLLARQSANPATPAGELEGTRAKLNAAITEKEIAQAKVEAIQTKYIRQVSEDSQAANLVLVREASLVGSSRPGAIQRGAILGLGVGVLAGCASALVLSRRGTASARRGSNQD